jgi:hypothetical protein
MFGQVNSPFSIIFLDFPIFSNRVTICFHGFPYFLQFSLFFHDFLHMFTWFSHFHLYFSMMFLYLLWFPRFFHDFLMVFLLFCRPHRPTFKRLNVRPGPVDLPRSNGQHPKPHPGDANAG